ncbi:MAG: non-hydrolyzing UDP-N-acetylglucosamine 2-epimerase [Thermoplasmatota archaeon]
MSRPRIVTVVGARPQFIKLAPVAKALAAVADEVLVHSGQHYDEKLDAIFFEELGLPQPDHHLRVGSAGHGVQTARILEGVERVIQEESPDALLVYGDTNTTLGAAIAASKLHVPIFHVEAGLRSFDRAMPEEVNRVLTDHVSELLFAPTEVARGHLEKEGITKGVHVVGDVMVDAVHAALGQGPGQKTGGDAYVAATLHRAENTDDPARLRAILTALAKAPLPVRLPLHPRTQAAVARWGLEPLLEADGLEILPPLGYGEMLRLVQGAQAVVTDSGGLQKEAYVIGTPCVTVRGTTEWPETIEAGWNRLCPPEEAAILAALEACQRPDGPRDAYGDGQASHRIAKVIQEWALDRIG